MSRIKTTITLFTMTIYIFTFQNALCTLHTPLISDPFSAYFIDHVRKFNYLESMSFFITGRRREWHTYITDKMICAGIRNHYDSNMQLSDNSQSSRLKKLRKTFPPKSIMKIQHLHMSTTFLIYMTLKLAVTICHPFSVDKFSRQESNM
jgi:hypothetical protein